MTARGRDVPSLGLFQLNAKTNQFTSRAYENATGTYIKPLLQRPSWVRDVGFVPFRSCWDRW